MHYTPTVTTYILAYVRKRRKQSAARQCLVDAAAPFTVLNSPMILVIDVGYR